MKYLVKLNDLEQKVIIYKEKNDILAAKIISMEKDINDIKWIGPVGTIYKEKVFKKIDELKKIYNNIEKYIEYLTKFSNNYNELYDEEEKQKRNLFMKVDVKNDRI